MIKVSYILFYWLSGFFAVELRKSEAFLALPAMNMYRQVK
jgi:hypothetical protein